MSYSGAATAKAARENLGRSLASLQEDPNIPQDVLAVAQNLAQAVGKLFEAERATNELDGKNAVKGALGLVGQTLALLQDVRGQHRGVQSATETLATSMSLLYPLTTVPSMRPQAAPIPASAPMVGAPAPVAPVVAPAYGQPGQATQAYHQQAYGQPGYGQQTQAYSPPAPQPAYPQPAPQQRPAAQPQGMGFQQTAPSQVAYQPQAQPAFQQPSPSQFQQPAYAQPAAFQQPSPSQVQQPAYAQPAYQQQPQQPQQQPAQPAFQQPRANAQPQQGEPVAAGYRGNQNREKIEVNIGATTESNFFVGFSTEISEGGVFAATYNIQPRGTPMLVHITLPGGFDKIVNGIVKFVRDPMDLSADDTVPGMGIQFEGLDPEGRELILRFIRKRPPMFYDE
ncbi:MAG: hypothetical protein K1X94_21055 [Sandaracinaceae bacterium]|nr:hypothetical protein [Sandaracinaceae bacterium]